MLLPSALDQWYAEAVTRVYAPWLTSTCVGISDRRRHEISELIRRLRRTACLPPLAAHGVWPRPVNAFAKSAVQPSAGNGAGRQFTAERTPTGRWTSPAA